MAPAPLNEREGIAVIGMSCRFPSDADTAENFWEFIRKGRNAYSENPGRWNPDAFHYGEKKLNTSLTRGGHFLKSDVASFDANFFNVSKVEAESMDPQQRIIMEVTHETMENAGLPAHRLAGSKTGVFMASFTSDYREMLYRDPETVPLYTATGTSNTSTSNRVSWFFDFRGPSFTVNTACSSSLVACHLACQSLLTGESETAVVGGTSLLLNPDMFLYLSNQQFLAPDGKCKSFDESGDGYGRGDGIGVIILKRVKDAIRDGDPIRAVIRGSGSNQDGHTQGFTLPSVEAQAQLILDTYHNAGLSLANTRYVEAHGTGTQAGDTRETEGLSRTFSPFRTFSDKLIVGSVKSNIGHLEACAGLASLIKCVFILETGLIPPTPSMKTANQKINWHEWRLQVPTTLMAWPTDGLRRVSTQGFGYGGTNAHIILDDAYHYLQERNLQGNHYTTVRTHQTSIIQRPSLRKKESLSDSTSQLFRLHAQDMDGLKRLRASLAQHLRLRVKSLQHQPEKRNAYLRDLAYTLSDRRSRLQWQTFAVADTLEELAETLSNESWLSPETRMATKAPRIGFIFTGQGAQWARMGVELMAYDAFRCSIEDSDRYLQQELGCRWSVAEELAKPESLSQLGLASYSQGICSVLQIALVDLLSNWNITPTRVAGHSSGEIAAAYCLGVLTKNDAVKAAYYRGMLSAELKESNPMIKGAMMAIGAPREVVEEWIGRLTQGEVVIACVNSPVSVTASGDSAGIDELVGIVQQAGVFGRKLKVDMAYHSPHMQLLAAQYFELLADMETCPAHPSRKMFSSVLGGPIHAEELGAANWVQNLVSTVEFSDAVTSLLYQDESSKEMAVDLLVEVGPHSALQGPIGQIMKASGISNISYKSILLRGHNAINTALEFAGQLLMAGVPVDVSRVNGAAGIAPCPVVDLPPYPWNHSTRFWAESRLSKEYRLREHPRLPLLGSLCPTLGAREKHWRGIVRLEEEPWIRDHVIQGGILYPGAGFLIMAIEAAAQQANKNLTVSAFRLRDVHLNAAMVVPEDGTVEAILQLRPHLPAPGSLQSTWMEFTVSSSIDGGDLSQNCTGLIMVEYEAAAGSAMHLERVLESDAVRDQFKQIAKRCLKHVDVPQFYSHLNALGLTYGPTFTNVTEILRQHGDECVGTIRIPHLDSMVPPTYRSHPHIVHPSTLDAIFHLAFAATESFSTRFNGPMVPTTIDEMMVSVDIPSRPGMQLQGFARSSPHGFRELVSDISMLDKGETKALLCIKGFRCSEISGGIGSSELSAGQETRQICFSLTWKPAVDLLTGEELQAVVRDTTSIDASLYKKHATAMEDLARHFMLDTLDQVSEDTVVPSYSSFYSWLKQRSIGLTNGVSKSKLGTLAESFQRFGETLTRIIQGKVPFPPPKEKLHEIRELLVQTGGISELSQILNEYLTLRHHTKPNLSILEVGLCSAPLSLFATLPNRQSLLETIQYTMSLPHDDDVAYVKAQFEAQAENVAITVACFDALQEHTAKHDLIIIFDPGYDSVIPGAILRETRKLLNEGGKIILAEISQAQLPLGMLLGSLQWTRSFGSKQSVWEPCLHEFGLEAELMLADSEPAVHNQFRLLVSGKSDSAVNSSHHEAVEEVVVVESANSSSVARSLATVLTQKLARKSIRTRRFLWGSDVSELKGQFCIVLTDLEEALLKDPTAKDFGDVQSLILQAGRLLWVSGPLGPDSALMTGLARSVRNEVPGIQFRTLQVEDREITEADAFSDLIVRVWQYKGSDDEFITEDHLIKVGRLVEEKDRNEKLAQLLGQKETPIIQTELEETPQALKLCARQIGMLDSLCYESDELATKPLVDGEIEVEVKASGINFRDVMVAMGQIPDRSFGFEAAGIVRRVSPSATRYRPGDRVVFRAEGAHRTIHRVPVDYAVPLPETMTFSEGASLLLVHTTAWYGLVRIARANVGQTVLIHAAAGGVGQAAIMIAKHLRLRIFATVSSDEKRQLVRDTYGIPDDHIFYSRDLSFVKGVKRMTGGRGVDIVLNSLSGEALRQTWYCLAPFGTFVEVGMKDILDNMRLDMKPFIRDATFAFFNFNHIEKARPDLMREALRETMALVDARAIKPVTPITSYPASETEAAFRQIQTGQHLGKLVLTFQAGDFLPVIRPEVQLSSSASYLLVGGLGGLGRSLALLFVRLGARQLCFLSRSGAKDAEAQAFLEELETQHGVRTLVCKGDVSDEVMVASAVKQCTETLGPVRGVVQCAMVLHDSLFEKMSHEQWRQSTRPKVQGTWNLHEQLPNVDFFITLSSFAGVFGSRGQSNYAAGGAYEDALAHYRNAHGLKAVTLDLGIMRDVGVLAEKGITDYLREWEEPFGIRESEFHALIKSTIASQKTSAELPAVQIPTGLATARSIQTAGIGNPFYFDDARFSILAHLRTDASQQSSAVNREVSVQTQLARSQSFSEAAQLVQTTLLERVAKSLRNTVSEIDPTRPLNSYGVDSLVAVEVVKWVFKELQAKLTVFEILANIPITVLSEKIATKSSLLPKFS